MKKILFVLVVLTLTISCDRKKSSVQDPVQDTEKKVVKETNETTDKMIDPDPDDGVPPERYSPHNSNIQIAEKIKGFLVNNLLKDDLKALSPADRKFKYEEVDLNGDGKKEYLVGFSSPYFCGTGGCTFMLLNNDGSLVTAFSVSEAPFIVEGSVTNGWKDLLVTSGGKLHVLKFNGKTYPSNPSVAPVFKGYPSDDAYRLLWDEFPIPTFKF